MIDLKKLELRLLEYNRKLVKKYDGSYLTPATSIGGIYSNSKDIDHCQLLVDPIAQKLITRLSRLGKIGHKSTLCNNTIGSCCEVHVANNLILKHPSPMNLEIDRIKFTRARRPRTNQYIERCPNCVHVFGKEK
jgi:hypothetical protein